VQDTPPQFAVSSSVVDSGVGSDCITSLVVVFSLSVDHSLILLRFLKKTEGISLNRITHLRYRRSKTYMPTTRRQTLRLDYGLWLFFG
jgi:hypothetical protein